MSQIDGAFSKELLRAAAKQARGDICVQERERRSRVVCEALENIAAVWQTRKQHKDLNVAVYSALPGEVSLEMFVKAAFRRGWNLSWPCMMAAGGQRATMVMAQVQEKGLAQAPFLLHPARSFSAEDKLISQYQTVDPKTLDVIVVPVVAFDAVGARLGYGGGNYDRYLATLCPKTLVAGVAFAEQQYSVIPREPHDRRLSVIVYA